MTGHIARILRNGVEARVGPYASREILLEALGRLLEHRADANLFANLWRHQRGNAGSVGIILLETIEVELTELINRDSTERFNEEELGARDEIDEQLDE